MRIVTVFFLLCLLFLLAARAWSQELTGKSWPKNMRLLYEETEKQEDVYYNEYMDSKMRLLLLHPDEAKKEKEEKLKRMKSASGDEGETAGSPDAESKSEKEKEQKAKKKFGTVLKASDIFTYSPMWEQLTNTELLASGGILSFLFANDRVIYNGMEGAMKNSPFWKTNGSTINAIGEGPTAIGLYAILAVCGGQKNLQAAQVGLESFAYTGLQVLGLKSIYGKSRPSDEYERRWTADGCDAFPSGHTATAFSMATVLDRMYNIGWIAYPLAGLNGIGRIQANTHWLSDVFAGALMGHLGAKEIMARHGIIDRKKLQRRENWENNLYQVDSYVENSVDSCANFDEANPQQDDVGIMALNYSIAQVVMPAVVLQLNSRFHKKTFNTLTWNNLEDQQVDFRLSHKIAPRGIFYVQKSFQNINFIDVQPSYYNRGKGHFLPDPENYLQHNAADAVEGGFMWEFSPRVHGKVCYDTYTGYYDAFEFMNGYGHLWRAELGSDFGKDKEFSLRLGYRTGEFEAALTPYSYTIDGVTAQFTGRFKKICDLNLLYSQGNRDYRGSAWYPQSTANDRWSLYGAELNRNFDSDWMASLKYYKKDLISTNPGWSYRKNVYSINVTNRF